MQALQTEATVSLAADIPSREQWEGSAETQAFLDKLYATLCAGVTSRPEDSPRGFYAYRENISAESIIRHSSAAFRHALRWHEGGVDALDDFDSKGAPTHQPHTMNTVARLYIVEAQKDARAERKQVRNGFVENNPED